MNEWSYPSQMLAKSTTTKNHPSTPPSNKMCGFREEYVLKKFNWIKMKMAAIQQDKGLKEGNSL